MRVPLKVLILVVQVAVAFSALPNIQKCQLKDSNCIKLTAQTVVPILVPGIPEVGSESLDPLHVDLINVDLAGLKLIIRDAEITGHRNAIIDQLSVDMGKKQMKLKYHSDFDLKGKYKASGRLLILPISGDGETIMKNKNCEIIIDMAFNIAKNKNGKDFIDLKSYRFNYDVKDNAQYYLSNLFNGNKDLSDAMHTFINSNWKLISTEFGGPVFEQSIKKIYNSIKAYLKSQPLEEIAIV